MHFLLVYPPVEPFFIKKTKVFYGLSPPLGLLYIAKMLENDGDTVTLLDFSAEPYDEETLIKALRFVDALGLTILSPSVNQAKKLIDVVKRHRSDLPIIIGGPHCTLLPEEALNETQAQISIQGDGEPVIRDVKKAIKGERSLSDIPGIWYQTTGEIKKGPAPNLIVDIDSIPFPARHLVKDIRYGSEYNHSLNKGEFTSIVTSRGCPYHCRFCSRGSINMQQYRMRSTENILKELKEIQAQGYKHVAFADDCFPVNRKQAFDLFEAIINEQLHLRFSITATRVDFADKELYSKMKQAGVTHIQFGLESGNQEVLDFYQKHTTIETIQKAVYLSHKTGFFTIGSFILGAPFETKDHFKKTIAFAQSLPLDSVSFLPLRYMVGSELWSQAVQEGKIKKDEYVVLADKNRRLGLFSKAQLQRFCMNAQYSFYMRPTFFINLLRKSLQNDDMSFVQSYISFCYSAMRGIFS